MTGSNMISHEITSCLQLPPSLVEKFIGPSLLVITTVGDEIEYLVIFYTRTFYIEYLNGISKYIGSIIKRNTYIPGFLYAIFNFHLSRSRGRQRWREEETHVFADAL